jgi:hypothetical protein
LDPQFFISDLGTELQIGLPKLHEWIHREVIKSGHGSLDEDRLALEKEIPALIAARDKAVTAAKRKQL